MLYDYYAILSILNKITAHIVNIMLLCLTVSPSLLILLMVSFPLLLCFD